jgi:multiple sugar transport system substrate-binding protein
MKTRLALLVSVLMVASMLLTACPAPTPQVVEKIVQQTVVVQPTAAPVKAAAKPFITWYQYDQNNVDPKADERVGNEYLRKTIPLFNKAFEGKWVWTNRYMPWDKLTATLVAAVQAKGEVPDLSEINSPNINKFHQNGTLQDLTAWAKAQKWWADMDPSALQACTAPDGKLLCIPMAYRPAVVYVWKDRWPNGFPKTPEQFLTEAERLKKEGKYAVTFFGSTDFDGDGASRAVWTTIASFGGTYDDGKGKMLLNTPENIAAIQFLRTIVQNKYVPDIAFAGKFAEEQAFMDSSAGAIPTGLFGYRYIKPLKAPSGKEYAEMLDAIAAGEVILQPMVAPAGKKPSCDVNAVALGIPVGAKNPEAAYDYINWVLAPEQNADYVLGPAAGFPVLKSLQGGERYQTPFYKQAAAAAAASVCRPYQGSLADAQAAKKIIMAAVYKLIKQDPTADIAAELTKAQNEYNK